MFVWLSSEQRQVNILPVYNPQTFPDATWSWSLCLKRTVCVFVCVCVCVCVYVCTHATVYTQMCKGCNDWCWSFLCFPPETKKIAKLNYPFDILKWWRVLFLTTTLGKKLVLPIFQLDALIVKKRTFHHFMPTGAAEKFLNYALLYNMWYGV